MGCCRMPWLVAGIVAPLVAVAVAVQPEKNEGAAAQPELDAESQAWMDAGTPGAQHAEFNQFVGTWDTKATFWMVPGAPPEESAGVMVNSLVLGGRWLKQEYKSELMGMPFEGLGHWGFDNIEQRYVSTWMDSMSTGMMVTHGTPFDAASKTFTSNGEFKDPFGKVVRQKHVITLVSPDKHTLVGYEVLPTGEERKAMELIYTRKSEAKPIRAGQ